jgi:phage-related protein
MDRWTLIYFETRRGYAPVRNYLDGLPSRERARVADALDDLEEFGTHLTMPQVRPIQGTPLWELRVRGRIQHRVLYVTIEGRRILLLHAFTKKSQRTPARDIQTAIGRLAEYEEGR